LKPFDRVIVIVLVPLLPCVIVKLFGEADRLKFGVGAAFKIRVTMVLRDVDVVLLVPVILRCSLPVGVVLKVLTVIVEEPEPRIPKGD